MSLLVDKRDALGGKPGLHVLIAGVSGYPNLPPPGQPTTPASFGMRQLSSTSLTAFRVAKWVTEHAAQFAVPLSTVRLLASSTAAEQAAEPGLVGATACKVDDFLQAATDWRKDAAAHVDGMTLFYFAGHGIQRTKDDAVLLLEGFADGVGGVLRQTVDVSNIFNGMAPSNEFPNMAQTQLYFVDACRDFLSSFRNFELEPTTTVFRVPLGGSPDRRCAPIFYAAVPGTKAQAIPNEQTLFSKALLDCLDGDAGDLQEVNGLDQWQVSVHTLNKALDDKMADVNKQLGGEQDFVLGGLIKDKLIHVLGKTPTAEVILEVTPAEALAAAHLTVLDAAGAPVAGFPAPLATTPFSTRWPAGFYSIGVDIVPPDPRFTPVAPRLKLVRPPRTPKLIKVTQ